MIFKIINYSISANGSVVAVSAGLNALNYPPQQM